MRKIIWTILVLILLIAAAWGGSYYAKKQGSGQLGAAQQDEMVQKDGFSVLLPLGWRETATIPGMTMLAVNAGEEITDPAARKINFQTNFAVTFDQQNGLSETEYLKKIKKQIEEVLPGITFAAERMLTINTNPAWAFEAEAVTQGIEVKVLVVLIKGQGDDVWLVTFNGLKEQWETNAPIFEKIAKSFLIQ